MTKAVGVAPGGGGASWASISVLIPSKKLGKREPDRDIIPNYTEAMFNTFQIAEKTMAPQKARTHPPDIYLQPSIQRIKVLEFQKDQQIMEQVQPECERRKRELSGLLDV